MKATPCLVALLAAGLFATGAAAQGASQPLNLKLPPPNGLPPSSLPAASGSAAGPASSTPGMYYGDTSGQVADADTTKPCDDASYSQPQVHGSVGMGVMGGSHLSGNYQTGSVTVSRQLGDCDHPKGSVGLSISVGQGRFNGRGR